MARLFSTVIVGVDGSEPSASAVTFGARLAREHGGRLILCNAVNWIPVVAQLETAVPFDPNPLIEGMREQGIATLREACETAKVFGVATQLRVTDGEPAESILQIAHEEHAQIIVMGTHGRRGLGRLIVGSTTEALLRASDIPLLTVRAKTSDPSHRCFGRILVAIDDSAPADAAVETVLNFPAEDRRHVAFVNIADPRSVAGLRGHFLDATIHGVLRDRAQRIVDRALESARNRGVAAEGHVIEGGTDAELLVASRAENADLIVIGSHGRRGLQRFFLGSVAESIVRSAPIPVLVVRSGSSTGASTVQDTATAAHA